VDVKVGREGEEKSILESWSKRTRHNFLLTHSQLHVIVRFRVRGFLQFMLHLTDDVEIMNTLKAPILKFRPP
jgi:hypothetical protein